MKAPKPGAVFLAYLHPNTLSSNFHLSHLGMLQHDMTSHRLVGGFAAVRCDANGIPDGRNRVVEEMLATEAEWLFFVDADMGFRPDVLDRLWVAADETERPVMGGLAFAYKEHMVDELSGYRGVPLPTLFSWTVMPDGRSGYVGWKHYPVNRVVEVDATGAACILIHRSVLEAIGERWYDRAAGTDGKLMGEDISFCARAAAAGFPIHVHTGIRTNHHKDIWVGEHHFWDSFLAPPASDPTLVVVPTVASRIGHTERLMRSLKASTGVATALYVVDESDEGNAHGKVAHDFGAQILHQSGTFPEKINAAWTWAKPQSFKWFQVVGDDVVFRPGWLDHAQHVAGLYDAKVVGSNDLANPRVMAGDHATHWMIDTGYIAEVGASWDGPGVVAHEGYRHWFVDDEIVTAATRRGVFQMALGAQIEHLHPVFGKGEPDEVYVKNDALAKMDRKLFMRREAANR